MRETALLPPRASLAQTASGIACAAVAFLLGIGGCAGPRPLLAGAPLSPATAVQGRTPTYVVTPPSDVWRRLPLGKAPSPNLDLKLGFEEPGGQGLVKIWVYPVGDRSLAALASERRALVFQSFTVTRYEERRQFLANSQELVPVADARFTVQSKSGSTAWVLVRSLGTKTQLIEALGVASGSPSAASEVERLLQALAPLGAEPRGRTP